MEDSLVQQYVQLYLWTSRNAICPIVSIDIEERLSTTILCIAEQAVSTHGIVMNSFQC